MAALTFSHIGITVPDLEKAVEFYSKAFGLYVIMGPTEIHHDESAIGQMCDDVFGEGWGSFRIAHLSMGDGTGIELFEFPNTVEEDRPFEYWRRGLFHYLRGEVGFMPEFLRKRGYIVHQSPPPFEEILPRASHILSQAGALTSAAAFSAGMPQLLVPLQSEANLNAQLLEQQGVARRLDTSLEAAKIADIFTDFLTDSNLADRALELARLIAKRQAEPGQEIAAKAIQQYLT